MFRDLLNLSKEKGKYSKIEAYCIYGLLGGAFMLSLGIALNIFGTKGISPILAMYGSLISFLSTIALVIVWLLEEIKGE